MFSTTVAFLFLKECLFSIEKNFGADIEQVPQDS